MVRSLLLAAVMASSVLVPQASASSALASSAATGADVDFDKLIADHANAIVTVKFVLKMQLGGMGDREEETEAFGVMMQPDGLVLISNAQIGGFVSMMGRSRGMEVNVKPTNIKVLVGDDTVGVDAQLIARDTELDLAWIKIDKPADKGYPVLDFAQSAEPRTGEHVYQLAREGRFFDRVPAVTEFRIGAVTKKPRHLFLPGTQNLGMPIFNAAGKLVGVTILQFAGEEESSGSAFGGGGGGPAILPAAEILSATKRALETAAAGTDAEAAKPAEAPKADSEPATPTTPKAP
jgi:S1-C subfamily serine protease